MRHPSHSPLDLVAAARLVFVVMAAAFSCPAVFALEIQEEQNKRSPKISSFVPLPSSSATTSNTAPARPPVNNSKPAAPPVAEAPQPNAADNKPARRPTSEKPATERANHEPPVHGSIPYQHTTPGCGRKWLPFFVCGVGEL